MHTCTYITYKEERLQISIPEFVLKFMNVYDIYDNKPVLEHEKHWKYVWEPGHEIQINATYLMNLIMKRVCRVKEKQRSKKLNESKCWQNSSNQANPQFMGCELILLWGDCIYRFVLHLTVDCTFSEKLICNSWTQIWIYG